MKISRRALSFLLVFVVIGGLSIFKFYIAKARRPALLDLRASSRVKGDASAMVKIVEYTDFECPSCASASGILDGFFKANPGRISIEHKHFPLPRHAHARRAAIFADCAAAQRKFWEFHDVLFKSQKSWAEMVSVDAYFSQLAVSLGLDGARLAACVNSPGADLHVTKDLEEGHGLQVNSTPTVFINGKRVVGTGLLSQEIENALGKK